MNEEKQKVKAANRAFYDIVGGGYEAVDGRRSERLVRYLEEQLVGVRRATGRGSFLDLGCGNGFVARTAKNYFKRVIAADISFKILEAAGSEVPGKLTADSDRLPLKSSRLDCVATFAVLHHCYAYEELFAEIYRVLKDGGVYYSDHDMDSAFFRRFRPFLRLYRKLHDAKGAYLSKFDRLSEEIYDYSEFHREGVPSEEMETLLRKTGFREVEIEYHWFGLSPLADKLFGKRTRRRSSAPLVRIFAVK